ncbi:I78 family peptidase inhibitor [Pseudomonas aeruginosa]|uniref:I78 family peptidase inhibitor n=1 Tax=Pseudomonas aeruginosa TaxID=287 RepID=UPI000B003B86|nr:I78 family peptidase inhibitor [Pseudomonas aeruginosa]
MPLKQFSSALVLAALLAGCSSNGDSPSTEGASVATGSGSGSGSAPAATPAADGRCDANAVQAYVGKQASAAIVEEARRAAGAEVARALRPHDAVTMDYNPRRLNIDVDDTLVIKRLSCG